ncbi:YbeU/YbeR family protein [Lysobacter sp. FW306-1B-D06B]|uniref:YbeU/YbeR family protein n=1 Tax=Lysobacter sp. FW306-1B-D06B TaxID=3140250 RepID=UPI0031403C61
MSWWLVLAVAVVVLLALILLGWLQGIAEKRADQARIKVLRLAHEKFAQPVDREQLLSFGALMLLRNEQPTRILVSAKNKDDARDSMIEWWGITDAQTARETIQSLIIEGRRAHYQKDFLQLEHGASLSALKSFDGTDYLRWERAKEICKQEGLSFSSAATHTMAAYDYERIAWLARTCYQLEYLTLQEMWRCLAWVAQTAQAEFSSWSDYAASFVMGRAATFSGENCDDLTAKGVRTARELLSQEDGLLGRPHLWQEYPLAAITIPAEMLEFAMAEEDTHSHRRAQLLGFGALTGRAYGEPISDLKIPSSEPNGNEIWLANAWDVADTKTAVSRLEWLLDAGTRSEYEENFRKISRGAGVTELEGVRSADYVRLRHAKEQLIQAGMEDAHVSHCQSMLAYDLERAAYLARIAFAVGYLDEEYTLACLRRIASLARSTFTAWENYLTSFLLTQAFFNQDAERLKKLIKTGMTLLKIRSPFTEYGSPWQTHPLQDVAVLHVVRSVDMGTPAHP